MKVKIVKIFPLGNIIAFGGYIT